MTTIRPPAPEWAPPAYAPAPRRRRSALPLAVAIVGLIASAALVVGIVALSQGPATPTTGPSAPAFTQDQIAAAKADLCSTWSLASAAIKVETNHSNDPALARVALTNSASMMEAAVADHPALTRDDRDTALAVARASRRVAAISSTAAVGTPDFNAAIDAGNSASNAMQSRCAG
ncbi:MAG: hypothetical protein AB7G47_19555 [Mycolicibacterium sp.]|uniref:hypothetical protein n=1 Tax=Mycolicibacterium sp. TaxID=2320850 RepID=UPI003D0CF81B